MSAPDATAWREGRRRLRDWLPAAREQAANGRYSFENESPLMASMKPYLTEAKLQAVLIYPATGGGWYADVAFTDMPPGVSNVVGTPVHMPEPTRAAAEASARRMLEMALALIQQNSQAPTEPPPPPAFNLFDCYFSLRPEALLMATVVRQNGGGELGRPVVLGKIAAALKVAFPDGGKFSEEAFNHLSLDAKARLMVTLHVAAANGVMRYPPSKPPAAPSPVEPSQERH